MIRWHRSYLWLALALVAIILVAAALWLHGTRSGTGGRSALPTPAISADSPISTPTLKSPTPPPTTRAAGGAVLLWVSLGIVLALGIALVILRWQSHDTEYRDSTK